MYYFIDLLNYTKKGLKRTLILNPKLNRAQIRLHMEKHFVNPYLIHEMEKNGIYLEQEISFTAGERLEIYWANWNDEGQGEVICDRRFARKDKVIFHPNGTYSWKCHYTIFDRIWLMMNKASKFLIKDTYFSIRLK